MMGRARSGAWHGLVALIVGVVGACALVPAGVALAGDANRGGCSLAEASPGFRAYLPDCRAYELVTPPYKGSALVLGLGGEPVAVSKNGGQVLTSAGGAFAGAGNAWLQLALNSGIDAYELTRSASGWQPTALTPPAARFPYSNMMAASADLGNTLWGATTNAAFKVPSVDEGIYVRSDSGVFSLVGPGVAPEVASEELGFPALEELTFAGASRNLTRLLFKVRADSLHAHSTLWPGDSTGTDGLSLYEYFYGGVPSAEPALVGVKPGAEEAKSLPSEHPQLISSCQTAVGASQFGGSTYNAVSADGEAVFFTAGACSGKPEVNELYARVGGVHTVALSEPPLSGAGSVPGRVCTGVCEEDEEQPVKRHEGVFEGASSEGSKAFFSKAFFLSEQPLVNEDTDTTTDLYMAEMQGTGAAAKVGRLVMVSAGEAGVGIPGEEEAEVQGVVRVSEDGSRVYFVAKGVLAGRNAEEKEPLKGADNLYVYDTVTGRTVFVATLLNPAEEASIALAEGKEQELVTERAHASYVAAVSVAENEFARGEISEERENVILRLAKDEEEAFIERTSGTLGPAGTLGTVRSVWVTQDNRPVQATADGGFLVFLSSANLTGDDGKQVPQLFEYDAGREKLTRVSIGQGGSYEHDGAVETFRDAPSIPAPVFNGSVLPTATQTGTAVSGDGSRVFFTSAGRLTPEAVPGATNVYEYREGNVYLISDGRDAATQENSVKPAVALFGADASGGNVFFTSADALVPQDAESQLVLYDAREEGGFPAPVLAPGCVGETCRGSSGGAPQLGLPQSVGQASGETAMPPAAPAKAKPKALSRAQLLAKALKACRAKHDKHRRAVCESQARKRYGVKAKAKKTSIKRRARS